MKLYRYAQIDCKGDVDRKGWEGGGREEKRESLKKEEEEKCLHKRERKCARERPGVWTRGLLIVIVCVVFDMSLVAMHLSFLTYSTW